jgi:hypothetical protein
LCSSHQKGYVPLRTGRGYPYSSHSWKSAWKDCQSPALVHSHSVCSLAPCRKWNNMCLVRTA